MPVVWIVQKKLRLNIETGKRDIEFNYDEAKEFGELKFLFDNQDSGLAQQPLILKLKRELLQFKPEDNLILVGDAPLIGSTMVIVAQYNRQEVPLLIYERFTKSYYQKVYKF